THVEIFFQMKESRTVFELAIFRLKYDRIINQYIVLLRYFNQFLICIFRLIKQIQFWHLISRYLIHRQSDRYTFAFFYKFLYDKQFLWCKAMKSIDIDFSIIQ